MEATSQAMVSTVVGLAGRDDVQAVLGLAVDETLQVSTVGPNYILELGLGIEEVRNEGRLRDRMPIEARILMYPVGEMISRYCKRRRSVEKEQERTTVQ